jgi:hypothetical protein
VLLSVKQTEPDVFALECRVSDSETHAAVCEKNPKHDVFALECRVANSETRAAVCKANGT